MKTIKTSYKFLFVLAMIPFLMVNIFTLKDGHDWGGDFAQYIRHAKNILDAKDYASGLMLDQWVVTPPGFPLLLVPILKYFGLNFIALKSLNVIFWLLFVIAIYIIFKERLGDDYALLGGLVLLSSPDFFTFKQNIVSDVSFLFFLTAAILAFIRYVDSKDQKTENLKTLYLWVSSLFMAYAFCIRWAGVSLFISAVIYLLVIKKDYRSSAVFIFVLCVTAFLQSLMGVTGAGYLREIPLDFSIWSAVSFEHTSVAFNKIIAFFMPLKTAFSIPAYAFFEAVLNITGPFILLAIVVFAVYKTYTKKISYIGLFFVVYLLGILLWPVPGGRRYVFPLVGLSMIFIIELFSYLWERFVLSVGKLKINSKKIVAGVLILLILHNVLTVMLYFRYDKNVFQKKENRELISWVKNNTSKDEHFMFHKPRALGLLTDRVGAAFWIHFDDKDRWYQRIETLNIKYVIFTKDSSEYKTAIEKIGPRSLAISKIWENDVYAIYKR